MMEEESGRRRRSVKPKAFSPEPEPVRKPKAKPVARVSKEKPARLSLPEPSPPVSSIVPGTNKLVLNLSALKSYSTTDTAKVKEVKKPSSNVPKNVGQKRASTGSTALPRSGLLKLSIDIDTEAEKVATPSSIESVGLRNVVATAPLGFRSKTATPVSSRPGTPALPSATGILSAIKAASEESTQNESVSTPPVRDEALSISADEKVDVSPSEAQNVQDEKREPGEARVPVVKGRTVLVGKNLKPVLIATPNLAERRSTEGRSRKPPPSKDYAPDPIMKKATPRKKSPPKPAPISLFPHRSLPEPGPISAFPSVFSPIPLPPPPPLTSIPPMTPVAPDPPPSTPLTGFSLDISRPGRNKAKNVMELAPSLLSKKDQARLKPQNIFDRPRVQPATSWKPKPPPSVFTFPQRPLQIPQIRHRQFAPMKFESSPEAESPIDQSDPEVIHFFGNPVDYLKSLSSEMREWLSPMETTKYKDEFFRREMFMDDSVNTKKSEKGMRNLVRIMTKLGIDEEMKEIEEDEVVDVVTADPILTAPAWNQNLFHQAVLPYAEKLIQFFPENRMSFEGIEAGCRNLVKSLVPKKIDLARCLLSILEIVKDQRLVEITYSVKDKGIAGFYSFTLQNAEKFKFLLFQNFSKNFVGAHEILLSSLELSQLCSYLNLLRFLKAAGTTSGSIFISHASEKFQKAKHLILEILNLKVRDPYYRIMTTPGSKLVSKNVYLLLVYPGVYDEANFNKPIYHSHESIFRHGLPNIGAATEKIVIRKKFQTPPTTNQLTEWAVSFMREKLREVVLRRPKDRIFVACWGGSGLYVHEAALTVDGISGIIDFAIPLKTPIGYRGMFGDRINYTYCPTLMIVGERARSSSVKEIEIMRKNMIMPASLLVVGKADDYLYMSPEYMARKGITQSCVNRMIVEHVVKFIDKVMKTTKQGVHTVHLDIPDFSAVLVDINDYLFDEGEEKQGRPRSPASRGSKRTDLQETNTTIENQQETMMNENQESKVMQEESEEEVMETQEDVPSRTFEARESEEQDYDEDLMREAQEAAAALESNFDEDLYFEDYDG
ncbi:hypothetical protein FO519_007631 [Halicephalobus sp. NKZ332]|nr:hypothetical protein FO519_007631 [Halicephalobus sp. NKZ332]